MRNLWLSALVLGTVSLGACSKRDSLGESGLDGEEVPWGGLEGSVRLVVETPSTLDLDFAEEANIVVRVVYEAGGTPVGGRPITWTIVGNGGNSSLQTASGTSGADGRAQNRVIAGDTRTSFHVRAATAQLGGGEAEARILVTLQGEYTGTLRVRYTYNDVVAVKDITTKVHDNALNCSAIDYAAPPPHLASQVAINPTATLNFTTLTENRFYTVTAVGLGPRGNAVAYGCAVTDAIVGRGNVTVTVPLRLKPATMTGTYDFGTKLHLTEALPGRAGIVVSQLEAFFYDPADVLAGFLVTQLAQQLDQDPADVRGMISGAWTYYAISEGINGGDPDYDNDGNMVDDFIKFTILARAPAWLNDAFTIGGDVTSLLTNLKVGGKLEIRAADATGAVTGHWDWADFLWQWRLGVAGCNYENACCGRHLYSGDEIGMIPVGADWTGRVTPVSTGGDLAYDFDIDQHRLELQYGALVLFALERFVLPSLTGQNSVQCSIESMLGCNDGGVYACGQPLDSANAAACGCARAGQWLNSVVGVSPTVGETACNFAMTAATEWVEERLMGLTFGGSDDSHLLVSAASVLTDSDDDLATDFIDGSTVGTLVISGDPSSFTGELLADEERTLCVDDDGCGAGHACALRFHPMDDCAGRNVCAYRVGDRVAGQSCTTNAQCATGVCLTGRYTCYTACGPETDCPGTLTCDADGANVPVSAGLTLTVSACTNGQ